MNEAQTALRATERAQKGLTIPLSRIFAALTGAPGPARLARKFQADTRQFVAALDAERPEWQRVGQPWMSSSSHDVLADRMDEDEDPRADIIRGRIHESGPGGGINHMAHLASKASASGIGAVMEAIADQRIYRTGPANMVVARHADGGRTAVHRIRLQGREPVYHIRTYIPAQGNDHDYQTAMSHKEFNRWRESMEPEERENFLFPDEHEAPPGPDSVDHNARELNKPVKHARHTAPDTDLFNLYRGVQSGDKTDHTAAGVLADWLQEHDDWREHLARAQATQSWPEHNASLWTRPDGVNLDFGKGSDRNRMVNGNHGVQPTVWFAHSTEGEPRIGISDTMWKPGGRDSTGIFSVHTPEEYDRMHADAASAGHPLPYAPASHAPKQTKLARAGDALTYVGGHVPGGQRAQGFWTGGTEKSTVVRVPSQFVDRAAVDIARHNGQKSALWFKPGAGSDVLHVLRFNGGYPRSLSRILRKHGVSEFTITQNPVSVHVVDKGGILSGAVRAAAAESGAQYEPQSGTAGYAELQTKLARKRDTDPRARAQELNAFLRAAHYGGYQISDLHPFADWLREVTGNPDDPRAHVVQNHAHEGNPDPDRLAYYGIHVNAPLFSSAKNRPSGLLLSFLHTKENWLTPWHGPAVRARVEWAVPHPGAKNPGSDRTFRTFMTGDQLHEFIDKLPQPHQAEWRSHAANHGMIDNREKM